MSKHRGARRQVRPRFRVGAMGMALGLTIAVGGASVVAVPQLKGSSAEASDSEPTLAPVEAAAAALPAAEPTPTVEPSAEPAPEPTPDPEPLVEAVTEAENPPVPADSGSGRRIVFDEGDQRVWLVEDDETVERTYLVSGSRFDNLDPGTYAVQSRSRTATAFDYSGTMEYFVRFATGFSAPIGFHSVPRYNNGELEQTKEQLGTPLSAGCVRQWMPDAVALWEFAPIGTPVIVTP